MTWIRIRFTPRALLSTMWWCWTNCPTNTGSWSTMSYKEKIAERAAAREVQRRVRSSTWASAYRRMIPKYLAGAAWCIWVHSENGILGMGLRCRRGTEDRNLIDAGGNYVTLMPAVPFFDSALSFALVRGGRLDMAFLGALEISSNRRSGQLDHSRASMPRASAAAWNWPRKPGG